MIELVVSYLRQIQHFDVKEEFEDLFYSHPNYPSVFAITDTLDTLDIENAAFKIPKEQLSELPEIFLAVCSDAMVLACKKGNFIQTETAKGIKRLLTEGQFLLEWEGIVILAEPAEKHTSAAASQNLSWLKYSLPVVALAVLSMISNSFSPGAFFILGTTATGLLAGIFILQEKFGIKNETVSKFCNIAPKASCDSVIRSNSGAIAKWLSFADLPLVFFSTNLFAILLSPQSSPVIIIGISMLSLPVIAYSIWLQKFRIKQWCMLCLMVSAAVVVQSSGLFFVGTMAVGLLSGFAAYAFAAIFVVAAWAFLKPVLERKLASEKELNETIKFKRNYDLFRFLSKDIPVPAGFEKLRGIQFGSGTASVKLTLFLSPSCGHCHHAVEDIFALMEKYPEKISFQACFNLNPDNKDNVYRTVAEQLLIISNSTPEKAAEAVADWHIHQIGLEQWIKKWETKSIDMAVNHQLHFQYQWCLANDFNYAPVKIINGKLFPDEYGLKDLKYFFNDFSDESEFQAVMQVAHA